MHCVYLYRNFTPECMRYAFISFRHHMTYFWILLFLMNTKSIYCLNTSSLNIMTLLRKLIDLTSLPFSVNRFLLCSRWFFGNTWQFLTLPAFLGQHLSLCLQFLIAWCKTEFKFNQIYIHKLKHDSQNFNTYMHVSFLIFYSFICKWIICLFMFKIYSINV